MVGSHAIVELLNSSERIRAIKRSSSKIPQILNNLEIDWVEADITDLMEIKEALKDVTTIVHCAAMVSFNKRDAEQMWKTNLEGTSNLLNVALTMGIKKFVHVSSVAALGRKKNSTSINENSIWEPSRRNSVYSETKYLSELEVFRAGEEGLEVAVVNPSIIIGPGQLDKSSTRLLEYVWKENKFYTNGMMNYVDVRDVAKSLAIFAATNIGGERFVLNAGNVTYKEFFDKVARLFGKKAPQIKVPNLAISLLAKFEAIRSFITGKEPLITKETSRVARSAHVFSSEKIKKKLNFEFRTLEDTLAWTTNELMQGQE